MAIELRGHPLKLFLFHMGLHDFDRLNRAIASCGGRSFNFLYNVITSCYLSENGVAHIQPRSRGCCDKKLAPVGVRTAIGHSHDSGFTEGHIRFAFIAKGFSPKRFPSGASSQGISPLNHKALNHSVKNNSVVVSLIDKPNKVFACLGSNLRFQGDFKVAQIGLKDHNRAFFLCHSFLLCNHESRD